MELLFCLRGTPREGIWGQACIIALRNQRVRHALLYYWLNKEIS
jgi:hypothetical protein